MSHPSRPRLTCSHQTRTSFGLFPMFGSKSHLIRSDANKRNPPHLFPYFWPRIVDVLARYRLPRAKIIPGLIATPMEVSSKGTSPWRLYPLSRRKRRQTPCAELRAYLGANIVTWTQRRYPAYYTRSRRSAIYISRLSISSLSTLHLRVSLPGSRPLRRKDRYIAELK